MEFEFSINPLFGDIITKVDHRVVPYNRSPDLCKERRSQMMKVLDEMGDASSKAQGLHGAITSGRKLEMSDHHVYIMKDPDKNGSRGAVVGFIKVGRKKLFVYDHNGNQHEMEPHCVLDFYVHESRQRQGCGKRLFQHMLKMECVKPQHLAIDRPSLMFSGFLHKHYGLKSAVPQVNNFVVFEGFFKDRTDTAVRGARTGSAGRPPTFPYRRPGSHGRGGHDPSVRYGRRTNQPNPVRPPSGRRYSSDTGTAPEQEVHSNSEQSAVLKDACVWPSPMETESRSHPAQGADMGRKTPTLESLHLNLSGLTKRPSSRQGMAAGGYQYSRHGRSTATPPPRQNSANRSRQNSATQQQRRQDFQSQTTSASNVTSHGNGGLMGARQANQSHAETTPLLLRREVTPVNHHDYMTRGGHLKLTSNTTRTVPVLPSVNPQQSASNQIPHTVSNTDGLSGNLTSDTTWTVFGVIPSGYNKHRQYAQRKYHHTKLW